MKSSLPRDLMRVTHKQPNVETHTLRALARTSTKQASQTLSACVLVSEQLLLLLVPPKERCEQFI